MNIPSNEHVDQLAKAGNQLLHRDPRIDYEHAHPTPYYLHKDSWPSMGATPYKGPIRHLQPYLQSYDSQHNLNEQNGLHTQILTFQHPLPSRFTLTSPTLRKPASSNFGTINTWAMPINNSFLAQIYILPSHVLSAHLQNPIPRNISSLVVETNTFTPYAPNAIIKQFGKFESS
jgi:hypothetical protein